MRRRFKLIPRELEGLIVSAVSSNPRDAHRVLEPDDGCWNSGGFAPAWIRLDAGAGVEFTGVLLLPELSLDSVIHLKLRVDDRLVCEWRGMAHSGRWLRIDFHGRGRVLEVLTLESASWVAWRRIRAFAL